MKRVLYSNIECIHNEVTKINGVPTLICAICENIIINTYNNNCNKYKKINKYLNRIK